MVLCPDEVRRLNYYWGGEPKLVKTAVLLWIAILNRRSPGVKMLFRCCGLGQQSWLLGKYVGFEGLLEEAIWIAMEYTRLVVFRQTAWSESRRCLNAYYSHMQDVRAMGEAIPWTRRI